MDTVGEGRVRIGISTCLMGQPVRYDGGHKLDPLLMSTFGPYVEWVPVCPEVELGMGTPREPVRLVREGKDVRLVTIDTAADHTGAMRAFARRRADELANAGLCGYVFKSRSPSCGVERVKVHQRGGAVSQNGRGLFAEGLMRRLPHLPVEEESRLADPPVREGFVERVFAYSRLGQLFAARWNLSDLERFHCDHQLQLRAHCPKAEAALEELVAMASRLPRGEARRRYQTQFMATMAKKTTARRHVTVMRHIAGQFLDRLDGEALQELLGLVEDFRRGRAPRVVPLTMLRHNARRLNMEQLLRQTYVTPHPDELMLRNHT